MDKLSLRFLTTLEEQLRDYAEEVVRFPKREPFDHGVQVGNWQGLETARQMLISLHKEADDEDSRL